MKKLTRIALGLFALSSPVIAEGPIENKIINNSKFDQTSPELHGIHFTSKPETIQLENGEIYSIDITKTKNGEIYSVGADSKYLLTQYLIKHNDGVSKHHIADFDCDGKRDYSIIAKDGTKYVYFSFENKSDLHGTKPWYVFPKDEEVIKPGLEKKINNNSKFDQTSPELNGIHSISQPETIQTKNGEIYSIDITKTKNGEIYSVGTDSKYLLIQYILKHNDGDSKYHSVDFDGDGRRDYVIIAKDGTKYVYFSFECPCDPCDDQTWYVFPKDEEVIKPYYE